MIRTIDRLLEETEGPIVLLQTGDVATFGGRRAPPVAPDQPDRHEFPEWEYWLGRCNAWRSIHGRRLLVMNLHGNHDVWPGVLPLVSPANVSDVDAALRALLAHQGESMRDELTVRTVDAETAILEVMAFDTVWSDAFVNTLALGRVSVPDGSGSTSADRATLERAVVSAIEKLEAQRVDDVRPRIRIAALHHPPHFCGVHSVSGALTGGVLVNARELADVLFSRGFSVVFAGHRHVFDPVGDDRPEQPPLDRAVAQFVTASPTQSVDRSANGARHEPEQQAFAVYELSVGGDRTFEVHRTIYRRDSPFDDAFIPAIAQTIATERAILRPRMVS